MTYEEILNTNGGFQSKAGETPYGMIVRKQKEGKYRDVFVVDSRYVLIPAFRQGIEEDCKLCYRLNAKQQLHYEIVEQNDALELELEQGSFQTLEQALQTNPALIAQSGFVDGIVEGLLDVMEKLHEQSVYYLCFSPRNVFVRKGDNMPMLLLHGSSFKCMNNPMRLFEDFEDFIAPELKEDGTMLAQSDIYSLGQLILWLFRQGSIPFEYKKITKKAIREPIQQRYESAAEMKQALIGLRGKKRSAMMLAAALAVALVCVGLFFELTPQTEDREFIEAVPKTELEDDILDSYEPEYEMILEGDTTGGDTLTAQEQLEMDVYMKTAEEIFRKRFYEKAEAILGKVYNNESMNASRKAFEIASSSMSEELVKLQTELAEESGLSGSTADSIANAVIDEIIADKERKMLKLK